MTTLVLFGFLIGWNSKEISLNEVLASSAATTLLGAIVGAVFGAFGTHKTNQITAEDKTHKLKSAFYDEVAHIQSYLIRYLSFAFKEYEQSWIDLEKPDATLSKPMDLDFNTLRTIQIELIKEKAVPHPDQRRLVHNLELNVRSIYELEAKRVQQPHPERLHYVIVDSVSKNLMFRLSSVIWHLENLKTKKDDFQFEDVEAHHQMQAAFALAEIEEQDELIKLIDKEYGGHNVH